MFTIINIIIIIIISNFMPECLWPQDDTKQFCLVPSSNDQIRVETDIQLYKIVLHTSGPESTLFYGVLVVFSILSPVSSLPPAKFSDDHPLQKLWQRDRLNITGIDDWCRKKKKLAWNRTCWCKIAITFKMQYLFQKCFKVPTGKYAFLTTSKIICFFFLICIVSNLVYIYFRDSNFNFRILYLILDYIIDNLKKLLVRNLGCYNIELS